MRDIISGNNQQDKGIDQLGKASKKEGSLLTTLRIG